MKFKRYKQNNSQLQEKYINILCVILIVAVVFALVFTGIYFISRIEENQTDADVVETEIAQYKSEKNDEDIIRGTKEPIPEDVRERMMGISYPADGNALISLDSLSYLTIPHYDFEGNVQMGEMIVDSELADEVLDIFAELFKIEYPIENMELIDKYYDMMTEELDSLDRSSMGRNNTSAFCYRVVAGTSQMSNHAFGRAIDLNPKTNPWVGVNGNVSPRNAVKYANRENALSEDSDWSEVEKRAFIGKDTEVYRIFKSYGWQWGGEIWDVKDYQHFEKPRTGEEQ